MDDRSLKEGDGTGVSPPTLHWIVSSRGPIALASEFERVVHVWNVSASACIGRFETIFDCGGGRVAVDGTGTLFAVATYQEGGVALHATATGAEVWRRQDIKWVQRIRFSSDATRVMCNVEPPDEDLSTVVLAARTGETIQHLPGVREWYDSRHESVELRGGSKLFLWSVGDRQITAWPRESFAILDASFAPGLLCTTESGGPVRCFSTRRGKELWRFAPPAGEHALRIGYAAALGRFVALMWEYESGGRQRLVHLNAADGSEVCTMPIESCADAAFVFDGTRLVTTEGRLYDTATGEIVGRIKEGHTTKDQ